MPLLADGLPVPITGEERYLRAVLDELRGLRGDLAARQPAQSTIEVREPEAGSFLERVEEQTRDFKKGRKR